MSRAFLKAIMGNKGSKDEKEKSKSKIVKEKKSKKHICLLVLHNEPKDPRDQIDEFGEFCDALEAHPSGKLEIEIRNDVLSSHVPDDIGTLSEPQKSEITNWISENLDKDRIVLICLMTQYDLHDLIQDPQFENSKRIIVFCFKSPPVTYTDCITVDIDFNEDIKAKEIKGHIKDLASAILDDTIQ